MTPYKAPDPMNGIPVRVVEKIGIAGVAGVLLWYVLFQAPKERSMENDKIVTAIQVAAQAAQKSASAMEETQRLLLGNQAKIIDSQSKIAENQAQMISTQQKVIEILNRMENREK